MPSPFTPAQLAVVETEYTEYMRWHDPSKRVDKNQTRRITLRCWEVGPRFHPTAVGKYFANRNCASINRPRATRKIPQQLALLRSSFSTDPYPIPDESILLAHSTGLDLKQVKQWFDNERKKVAASGQALYTRNGDADAGASAKLTRLYKTDPESTVRALLEARIDGVTGHVLGG